MGSSLRVRAESEITTERWAVVSMVSRIVVPIVVSEITEEVVLGVKKSRLAVVVAVA